MKKHIKSLFIFVLIILGIFLLFKGNIFSQSIFSFRGAESCPKDSCGNYVCSGVVSGGTGQISTYLTLYSGAIRDYPSCQVEAWVSRAGGAVAPEWAANMPSDWALINSFDFESSFGFNSGDVYRETGSSLGASSGGNQLQCGEANTDNGHWTMWRTTFIKSGNSLPCIAPAPARQDPVTRRSEPLVLIDEQGNSLGELEGYVVTLQPGEVKTLRMRTSIERLVNNESYAIQVSARAAGDEGEAANDYEWYKE